MKTYSFTYEEVVVNQVFFVADSEEEAQSLYEKVKGGEISFDELPEMGEKSKWYEMSFDGSELECANVGVAV
jgi:hypothetical protein